ncbi:hypothetical protein D9611_002251 [Ephemerocybe angulata]|uniref:Protein-lysine N-methyltransferase EFM6 n=1 Tax=Ephemerocybe angulata TaxID=980116 RepID=A0A8H5FEA7_9AGAR|nr:hypothetical protein D9611_002251 [Tulosesus angulatus]
MQLEQTPSETMAELILDEELDKQDPLRHLMDLDGGLVEAPVSSTQALTFLPKQSHSVEDGGMLRLSFSHDLIDVPRPLEITLAVDASPGCGGIAWPAGQILATYLIQQGSGYLKNKNVVELGAGTGLVGLVAGQLPDAKIWITDQEPLLPIMQKNVTINNLTSNVFVAKLDWGVPVPSTIPKPDIILAADCVYFEPAFPLLVQTLDELADKDTEILFCYKKRRKADKRFFGILKKKFRWEEVMDDPNRPIYNKEAITLMRLFKR